MPTVKAIDAPILAAYWLDPDEVVVIEDPKHPLYDERVNLPLDENLVLSIMATPGVKLPILVAKEGKQVNVVDGRQRVRAAREANKRLKKMGSQTVRVPAKLEKGDDADLFGLTILSNAHRTDDAPVSLARKAKRLLDMGKTEKEVGILFGWTSPTVKRHLDLLDLSPKVIRAVESGKVGVVAAAKLAALPKEEQEKALDEATKENGKADSKKVHQTTQRAAGRSDAVMPGKKQIKKAVALLEVGDRTVREKGALEALQWVLGEKSELMDGLVAGSEA